MTVPPPVAAPKAAPATPVEKRAAGGWRRLLNRRVLAAVVIGLVVGLVGVRLLDRGSPSSKSTADDEAVLGALGSTTVPPGGGAPGLSTGADPSASALGAMVVTPNDVAQSLIVALLPGGAGLSEPTLDVCNGTFPSEARRTARLQDRVFDAQGTQSLSTEAVLYADPASATQAFAELKDVVARCPATPVVSPVKEPTVTTKFNPAPDAAWPQTPTVNRLAYDFNTTDESGATIRTVAVYLQRGRALMGVYFFAPGDTQTAVAGETTMGGIVGVFAKRMAALPTSVVGS